MRKCQRMGCWKPRPIRRDVFRMRTPRRLVAILPAALAPNAARSNVQQIGIGFVKAPGRQIFIVDEKAKRLATEAQVAIRIDPEKRVDRGRSGFWLLQMRTKEAVTPVFRAPQAEDAAGCCSKFSGHSFYNGLIRFDVFADGGRPKRLVPGYLTISVFINQECHRPFVKGSGMIFGPPIGFLHCFEVVRPVRLCAGRKG